MGTRRFRKRKKHEQSHEGKTQQCGWCMFVCMRICVHMRVCICVCMYTHVFLCTCVFVCVYLCIHACACVCCFCMCKCVDVHEYRCERVFMHVCVHGCACAGVPMCACVCLYMHLHMCVSSCMAVWWDWQRRGGGREYKDFHISERSSARSGGMMKVE